MTLERRIASAVAIALIPPCAVSFALLWHRGASPIALGGVIVVAALWGAGAAYYLAGWLLLRLRTLSSALGALREGDFSMRVRPGKDRGVLGDLVAETNSLGELLREQRSGAVEAQALLRTVLAEIDVAIFAFDDEQRLRLTNRAGERLLGAAQAALTGRTAADLGLSEYLQGEAARTVEISLAGGRGRWGLRRTVFRDLGRRHQLLVLADIRRTLRDEERAAWQRLLRVLGHELNNTLAPIQSLSVSLQGVVGAEPLPADWRQDVNEGLAVIASRSAGLHRFMEAYATLARLPQPRLARVRLDECVKRVVLLETRTQTQLVPSPDISIQADPDQLEQLLLNLQKNAVDASGDNVRIGWKVDGAFVEIQVEDQGPGIANPSNLFVPFFTTKPDGSGIGLVLSRQIAEAHGGTLDLVARDDAPGCRAVVRLPL